MEITPEHEDAAHRLTHEPETPAGTTRAIPARLGYLAAVERLDGFPGASWEDAHLDHGEAFTVLTTKQVHLALDDEDRQAVHILTPTAARERAYELLVLADLAEAGA